MSDHLFFYMLEYHTHTLEPIYDSKSRILILGSFPSPKSREIGFYYGHKQNRFWLVMEQLFNCKLETIDDKIRFLHSHHIALWDVIESCEIDGAKDSSIQNVKVNDIEMILSKSEVHTIFTTGRKAYDLYNQYLKDKLKIEAIYLPSTSPLNARMKKDDLVKIYFELILPELK